MKLEKLNDWLEEAERLLMFLPDTEIADKSTDIIDDAIEIIRTSVVIQSLSMKQIAELIEVIRLTFRGFEFFI